MEARNAESKLEVCRNQGDNTPLKIFSMPPDLILDVLSYWISTISLAHLDTALAATAVDGQTAWSTAVANCDVNCAVSHISTATDATPQCGRSVQKESPRKIFLEIIRTGRFTSPGLEHDYPCSHFYQAWLIKRGVKVRHIRVDNFRFFEQSFRVEDPQNLVASQNLPSPAQTAIDFTKLQSLEIVGSFQVDKYRLIALLKSCPALLRFCVRGVAPWLTPYSVRKLLRLCPQLRVLELRGCEHVTRTAVQHICEMAAPRLEELTLSRCPITAAGVQDLATAAAAAETLANYSAAFSTAARGRSRGAASVGALADAEACSGNSSSKGSNRGSKRVDKGSGRGKGRTGNGKGQRRPSSANAATSASAITTGATPCIYPSLISSAVQPGGRFAQLRHLSLSYCRDIATEDVKQLVSSLTKATAQLPPRAFNHRIEGSGGGFVPTVLFSSLDISGCSAVDATEVVRHCAATCAHSLTTLNVSNCGELQDDALLALSAHCPRLRSLDLSLTTGTSRDALVSMLARCGAELRTLLLGCAEGVCDAVVAAAVHFCPSLAVLDVSDSPLVTDSALQTIARRRPPLRCLRSVNVRNCYHVQQCQAVAALLNTYACAVTNDHDGDTAGTGTGTGAGAGIRVSSLELLDIRNTRVNVAKLGPLCSGGRVDTNDSQQAKAAVGHDVKDGSGTEDAAIAVGTAAGAAFVTARSMPSMLRRETGSVCIVLVN